MKQIITKDDTSSTILTMPEIKAHCRIEHTDDDALLAIYRSAAIDLIEAECDVDIMPTTYAEYYCGFCNPLYITALPIASVTHVKYYDSDNALQTVTNTNYTVLLPESCRGIITFKSDYSFPATYSRPDAVIVTYSVGVGTIASLIKAALLLQIGSFYENRENETEANFKTLAIGVDRIIQLYKETKY